MQIGSLTLRKLRELEKESGMTGGSKEGAKKSAPTEEVRLPHLLLSLAGVHDVRLAIPARHHTYTERC
jgi:hypothetical protein